MANKFELRLGQKVLYGEKREEAVVTALHMSNVGLDLASGKYVIAEYDQVYCK